MRQTHALLQTYKAELKKRRLTYRDVAVRVGLSEASVKRLFSSGSLTVDRLEALCDAIEISLADLIRASETQDRPIQMLEEIQERELAGSIELLVVANAVLNGLSFDDIIQSYRFTRHECMRLLAKLNRLNIIELLPGNQIRSRLARNFRWRANGPIEQLFAKQFEKQFLRSRFNAPGEFKVFASAMLSRESNALIQKQLQKLVQLVSELHNEDVRLPRAQRFGSSLLLALRPWEPQEFAKLRRTPDERVF
ncbi:MAG TPA: helix-turn-helix transcriptional regulator [Pseudomonadales bacterium]|nr:helix-turn-helix transcriptional regulator [Pseudomonadales bacterium]